MWLLALLALLPCDRLHGQSCHRSLSPVYAWEGTASSWDADETIYGLQATAKLDIRGPARLFLTVDQDANGITLTAWSTNGEYYDSRWFERLDQIDPDSSPIAALLYDTMERVNR